MLCLIATVLLSALAGFGGATLANGLNAQAVNESGTYVSEATLTALLKAEREKIITQVRAELDMSEIPPAEDKIGRAHV
jgi:hypothetical protein